MLLLHYFNLRISLPFLQKTIKVIWGNIFGFREIFRLSVFRLQTRNSGLFEGFFWS